MFKFDLSAVLSPAASQVEYENQQNAIGKFVMGKHRVGKKKATSPGRTVRTQTSSTTSSLDNIKNGDQNSFSRTSSKFSWISENTPSLLDIFDSMRTESDEVNLSSPPAIRLDIAAENTQRKTSGLSSLGKNASSALKHLRRNMSLVNATSFDSETSNKRSRMINKMKKTRKSFATMHRDASVKVFEAFQGFEITPKASECDISYTYSAESNNEFGDNYEIMVPKIIHATPPNATRSLTIEDEKICEEDDDIRKLCDLMNRIRSQSIHDNENVASSIGRADSFDVSELDELDFRVTNETAPCRTPDCFDLMMFVNNEHEVLEYAPEDFERFDRE